MRKTHGLVLEGETQLTSKTFHGKGCKDRMVRLGPDLSFFALAENPNFEIRFTWTFQLFKVLPLSLIGP